MLLSLIEFFVLFLIITISYFNAKNFFFCFVYSFSVFGQFFLFKIGNVFTPTVFNLVLISILLIFVLSKYVHKYAKYFFVYIIIYIIYFSFLFVVNRIGLWENLILYKNFFVLSLFAILLIENIKQGKVDPKILIRTFVCILFLESCLGILQYVYPPVTEFFQISYEWGNKEVGLTVEKQLSKFDIYVLGTFLVPSAYAGYLMISLISLLFLDIVKVIQLNRNYFIVIVLGTLALLFTGIRSPFLIYLISVLYFLYVRYKKIFFPIVTFLLILLISNIAFLNNLENVGSLENPVERIVSGFAIFSGDYSKLEGSTFVLVIMMIPYIMQNPLLGVGLHNKSGYTLLGRGITLEDLSTTDSQLFFTIAEIGLVGLFICFFPFFYVSRNMKDPYIRKQLYRLFAISLLLTLIDMGVFSLNIMLTIYMIFSLIVTHKHWCCNINELK